MKIIIEISDEVYQHMMGNDLLQNVHGNICYKAVQNGTPIPDNATVCDIDAIRQEIEKVFCISVITNELRTPMEVKAEILQIIDKYRG